jgi:signal transduction histidine kinase
MSSKAPSDAQRLAELYARQQETLLRAGRSLHDQAGPLLSAAGMHLQLLKMDFPAEAERVGRIAAILEQALDNVRQVSQGLAASPVYRGGLERALVRLGEELAEAVPVDIHLDYDVSGPVPRQTAVALYDATAAALGAAVRGARAKEVEVRVRDKPALTVEIRDNGRSRGRKRVLAVAALLAGVAGLRFSVTPGKSTIVSIRAYATRRTAGG